MASIIGAKPFGGYTMVRDYTGAAEAVIGEAVLWRCYNNTGLAIPTKTPLYANWTNSGASAALVTVRKVIALLDSATRRYLVVALEAIAAGDWGWCIWRGPVSDMVVPSAAYTDGHAFKVHDGVITSMGAAPAASDNEFGVFVDTDADGATSRTALDVVLYGREALATT
jgi:hypothetical protein